MPKRWGRDGEVRLGLVGDGRTLALNFDRKPDDTGWEGFALDGRNVEVRAQGRRPGVRYGSIGGVAPIAVTRLCTAGFGAAGLCSAGFGSPGFSAAGFSAAGFSAAGLCIARFGTTGF